MNINIKKQKGFTLIETLMAIFILTMSVSALLSLAAGGLFSVRYARNQIVGDNLLQESIEYIRNSRDTAFDNGLTWTSWQTNVLSVDTAGNPTGTGVDGCFSNSGCYVDPYTTGNKIIQCSVKGCPFVIYYPDNAFYGYSTRYPFSLGVSAPYQTSFVRKITIVPSGSSPDQLIVTATVSWLNGTATKTLSQSMLITNWKK